MQKSKKLQLKKRKKAEAVKEAASSDKPLSLLLQHVQQVSPTLTWLKKPSSKKVKKWVLQSALKPTGHQVSANRLTAEEIAKAEGVIIAADKAVETARFDGKKIDL